jgi:mRNA-degrading endonuclease RelE of RelBE toxin-antitoxin system
MRTTVNIDDPILKELKELQKKRGKSLGRLMSDLLAQALRERGKPREVLKPTGWISRRMDARLDLDDKEALYTALERQALPVEREDGR